MAGGWLCVCSARESDVSIDVGSEVSMEVAKQRSRIKQMVIVERTWTTESPSRRNKEDVWFCKIQVQKRVQGTRRTALAAVIPNIRKPEPTLLGGSRPTLSTLAVRRRVSDARLG